MRGASALGQELAKFPTANVRVIVIWEPVIASDTGPPVAAVRAPLADPRVVEFWDEKLVLSPRVVDRAASMARAAGREPPLGPDDVAWDFVATYPHGVRWEDPFPAPADYGTPVVDEMELVEKLLRTAIPAPERTGDRP